MTEPSLALQKTVAARLKADAGVLQIVPAGNIFDRHGLPTVSPCIILGDDQTIRDPLSLADDSYRVAITLHLWSKGTNLVEVKKIAGAVLACFASSPRLWDVDDHAVVWLRVEQSRYLRDPGGDWAHGVLSFDAMLVEAAA